MNNTLLDVHNNLMATLEDLNDADLIDDQDRIQKLCKIASAKAQIAKQIVEVDKLGYLALTEGTKQIMDNDILRIE